MKSSIAHITELTSQLTNIPREIAFNSPILLLALNFILLFLALVALLLLLLMPLLCSLLLLFLMKYTTQGLFILCTVHFCGCSLLLNDFCGLWVHLNLFSPCLVIASCVYHFCIKLISTEIVGVS